MSDPISLSHEDAIRYFLEVVGPELNKCSTLADAVTRFAHFYTTTRVIGATPEDDSDGFTIEIGCFTKIVFPEPGDYRRRGDEADASSGTKILQVSIRRTVHPIEALPEFSEFDDDAFEMFFETYFDECDDDSIYGMIECFDPDTLVKELDRIRSNPPLTELLGRSADSNSYAVGGAG